MEPQVTTGVIGIVAALLIVLIGKVIDMARDRCANSRVTDEQLTQTIREALRSVPPCANGGHCRDHAGLIGKLDKIDGCLDAHIRETRDEKLADKMEGVLTKIDQIFRPGATD
jgi:hypothetical protein